MSIGQFDTKKNVELINFLNAIKKGNRDLLPLLGTQPNRFREATFDEIMSNEDDILAHINRVQVNFNELFFDFFDGCLIKHNDAGDIEYIFVTTTNDAAHIIDISEAMFDLLGNGFFDNREFSSFREHIKIRNIANGIYSQPSDAPMQIWLHDDVSFCLFYRITPLQQFTFSITVKAPKVEDHAVRRKGTILDFLTFIPQSLLEGEPIYQKEHFDGSIIKCIDYIYALEPKQWDLFNMIELRIFSDKKVFNKFVQTHLTLFTLGKANSDNKIKVVEDLYRLYGSDISSSGELEFYERKKIEEGSYWIGRTWRFNRAHAPLNLNNKDEYMTYEVRVDNIEDTDSFKIHIFSYHELVSLFGEE